MTRAVDDAARRRGSSASSRCCRGCCARSRWRRWAAILVVTGWRLVSLHPRPPPVPRIRRAAGADLGGDAGDGGRDRPADRRAGRPRRCRCSSWSRTSAACACGSTRRTTSGGSEIRLDGAATFVTLPKLTAALDAVPAGARGPARPGAAVDAVDHTSAEMLRDWLQRKRRARATRRCIGASGRLRSAAPH